MSEGKRKPGELSESIIMHSYNELAKGAGTGYGKGWDNVAGDPLPNERVIAMKQNLYKFAAAKTAAMQQQINGLLYDGDRLLSFDEFRRELDALNIQYNNNWLEAEYRTARQSGYMAQKWRDIQANKDLFPNLKYKTQEDDRVRPEHEALNNIIAPIDHPFWDKYFPPNGWRCRCDAVQTAEDPSANIPETDPGIKPEFEINVGKSGQIFNEDSQTGHRYFALATEDPKWPMRFELSKLEAGFETLRTKKGSKVKVSIYADRRIDEYKPNVEMAFWATDNLSFSMKIMPHLQGRIIKHRSNPEYLIDEKIVADRKTPDSLDYSKVLSKANRQKCKIVFIDLTKNNDTIENAQKSIRYLLAKEEGRVHPNIKEIYIVSKDKATYKHIIRKKAD